MNGMIIESIKVVLLSPWIRDTNFASSGDCPFSSVRPHSEMPLAMNYVLNLYFINLEASI